MHAGTLGLLVEPATEPLEDYHASGFTTLEVRSTQTYLDDRSIQTGRVAGTVETTQEEIRTTGGEVSVEEIETDARVWTPWVADVDGAGFVVAERTAGGAPAFPFDVFWARTGKMIDPARIDVAAFIQTQNDADRDWDAWMVGRKHEEREEATDDTSITYGEDALRKDAIQAELGVGFRTPWRGTVVRGVLYQSGYIAIYEPSGWGAVEFGRFVREEILPVAQVPDIEEAVSQTTLEEEVA